MSFQIKAHIVELLLLPKRHCKFPLNMFYSKRSEQNVTHSSLPIPLIT
jgi:hypothetical protein